MGFLRRQQVAHPAQGEARRSEEHTSELQSRFDLVCRLLLEKKNLEMSLLGHGDMQRALLVELHGVDVEISARGVFGPIVVVDYPAAQYIDHHIAPDRGDEVI